jgi:hypothetical protein
MTVYASVSEVKAALRITDNIDDSLITMATNSASELIDGYCQRSFGQVTAVRYFAASERHAIEVDDIATASGIVIATSILGDSVFDTTWAAKDFQLEPLNSHAGGLTWPYTRIRAIDDYLFPTAWGEATCKITATWGWPSVPTVVTQAAVIQASRIFSRLQSPLGVLGFGDMGAVRVGRALDPDVAQLLGPYVKMVGMA